METILNYFDTIINISNQYEEFIGAHYQGFFMTKNGLLYVTTQNGIYEFKPVHISQRIYSYCVTRLSMPIILIISIVNLV